MPNDFQIKVEGLNDLVKTFRKIDKDLNTQLKQAHKEAAETVLTAAQARAPVGPTGNLQASLKALASQKQARIKGGSSKVPYYGWIDFGGSIAPRGTPITRPFLKAGRIIYPAIAEKKDEVIKAFERNVDRILRNAGMR